MEFDWTLSIEFKCNRGEITKTVAVGSCRATSVPSQKTETVLADTPPQDNVFSLPFVVQSPDCLSTIGHFEPMSGPVLPVREESMTERFFNGPNDRSALFVESLSERKDVLPDLESFQKQPPMSVFEAIAEPSSEITPPHPNLCL